MEYPKFQTRIFGRMESAHGLMVNSDKSDWLKIIKKNFLRMLKNWYWPEVWIIGADQKDRCIRGREWLSRELEFNVASRKLY